MRRTDVTIFVGKKFGRLTIKSGLFRKGKAYFNCICDCGAECCVTKYDLVSGKTLSCGCYSKDNGRILHRKHGGTNERLYSVWCNMKRRCYNRNDAEYHNYGGRGIIVCDDWRDDYALFRDWAMLSGYEETLSIDRIDPDKNYCPENCRWIPLNEQALTRRNVIRYNGEPAVRVAREHGVSKNLMLARLSRLGWPIDEAIGLKPHEYPANWKGSRTSRYDI